MGGNCVSAEAVAETQKPAPTAEVDMNKDQKIEPQPDPHAFKGKVETV